VVNDSRGFYANRCVLNYIREGHIMLMEGVPAAMIENVGRMAGMPVGPLSLNDEVALDLGWKILKAAEAGFYPGNADEDIPERYGRLWTSRDGSGMTIAKPLRDLVRFRKLNLLNAWPIKGLFDVIFCRNVMIYFDEPTKELLLRRLSDQLAPGGFLYIGHSERLIGDAAGKFSPMGQTIYRKDRV